LALDVVGDFDADKCFKTASEISPVKTKYWANLILNTKDIKTGKIFMSEYITKQWPSTHYMVPSHFQCTICEILCVTITILPKDVQRYLVQIILLFLW